MAESTPRAGFTGFYRPGSVPQGTLVRVATLGMRHSTETSFCLLFSSAEPSGEGGWPWGVGIGSTQVLHRKSGVGADDPCDEGALASVVEEALDAVGQVCDL